MYVDEMKFLKITVPSKRLSSESLFDVVKLLFIYLRTQKILVIRGHFNVQVFLAKLHTSYQCFLYYHSTIKRCFVCTLLENSQLDLRSVAVGWCVVDNRYDSKRRHYRRH